MIAVVGAAVFALVFVFSSEVEGTLRLSDGSAPAVEFTPTRCRSGQLSGFFGVELYAEDVPDVIVRLMRDPLQGDLVSVERGGRAPLVLKASDCESLTLELVRTSTTINDVRNVEGAATLACSAARGELKFSGCH